MAEDTKSDVGSQQLSIQQSSINANIMNKLFSMNQIFALLSTENFFKKIFAIALKNIAVIFGLIGLVNWITLWGTITKLNVGGVIGGLIFQIIFIIAIYTIIHTLFIRATEIASLPESRYSIIPIASVFIKLLGELFASLNIPLAIGGGIFIWFAGANIYHYIPKIGLFASFGGGTSFFVGLLFIILNIAISFLVLSFFYFISEAIIVQVDIANNTRETNQIINQYNKINKR